MRLRAHLGDPSRKPRELPHVPVLVKKSFWHEGAALPIGAKCRS
jgi:hypothetical protein